MEDSTATAILRQKKSYVPLSCYLDLLVTADISISRPNRLMVDESPSDDNSVATLHPNTMETLGLFRYVKMYSVET